MEIFNLKEKIKYPKSFDDQIRLILILLKETPRTHDEIFDFLKRLLMQFGASIFLHNVQEIKEFEKIDSALDFLIEDNKIEMNEFGVYSLTDSGQREANKYTKGMNYFLSFLSSMAHPSISPIFSLILHIFLGILKIFGYFITGSVSLLSDGLDSTLDGASAIIVGISMKIKREIYGLYLLLILMIFTGLVILLQGIDRIVAINPLEDINIIFLIAIISIILVGLLYIYQRYSGYRNRNLTILAQSEDSKNHILNASLVIIAGIFGNFGFYFVDGFVAFFIGLLILYSSYNLFQDIKKQEKNEAINYEKYKLGMWKRYDKMQSEMLKLWILYTLKDSSKNTSQINDLFLNNFAPIKINLNEERIFSLSSSLDLHILQNQIKGLSESNLIVKDGLLYNISEQGLELLMNEISKQKHRIKPFGNRKTHFHK